MTPEELENFDIGLRNISSILAETAATNAETAALAHRTEASLGRAIRLAVRGARAERARRQAAGEQLRQFVIELKAPQMELKTSQAALQEALRRYLESRTHRNGGE